MFIESLGFFVFVEFSIVNIPLFFLLNPIVFVCFLCCFNIDIVFVVLKPLKHVETNTWW